MQFLKNKKTIAAILLCIGVFFGVMYLNSYYRASLVLITEFSSPFIHNGDGKLLTTIKTGEQYFVRIQTKRAITCNIDVTYYFEQVGEENGVQKRTLWYPYPTYKAKSLEGESITDRFIVIPLYMKPGEYNLVRQAVYDCGGSLISKDVSIGVRVTK